MRNSRNQRQKRADELLQQVVQKLYRRCFLCPSTKFCGHHFFPKSVSSFLRYDLRNMIPLCFGCHLRLHSSGDPSYEQEIIARKGQDWYKGLEKDKRTLIKANKFYYEENIARLEKILTEGDK